MVSRLFEKFGENFDRILVVGDAARFATTVHREDGIAHIDSAKGNRRGENVAQSAAASHIAVIDESLTGNACLLAKSGENRG